MKKLYLFLLSLVPLFTYAQTTVKGQVVDQSDHPLDAVTITLNKQNKNVSSALADSGKFVLYKVPDGNYVLTATSVGYHALSRTIQLPLDTLKIVMQADSKQLKEVTIAANKPIIERKIDRVTFNVENSIIGSGGSTWDALSKTPGVQARSDNTITANRKDVQLYMDGKRLNLSGDDLAAYLQGLPADIIAQIEIFSNPPSRFEAQGASVINILSKKAKKQGLNISTNGGYIRGNYGSYNAGTTFNYRKDKLNVYGNYSYSNRHTTMDHNVYINYDSSYWDSPNHNIYRSGNQTYRLGADYQLAPNQVIGFLVTGNNRTGRSEGSTYTQITSNNRTVLDSTLETSTHATTGGHRYSYNLNYNLKLDSSRQNLNIDLDYSPFQSFSNSYVNNLSFLPGGNAPYSLYRIYTPSLQNIDIYSGKADYDYKIGKTWSLSSGMKYSSIRSNNNFDFYNNSGNAPELVPANGNHFLYRENTTAGYTSISGSLGKVTVEAGLRAEYTQTRGYSYTLDSLSTKNYFKLFPTLFLQYKLDEKNQFQLTYGYRIERPEYSRLNPAKHYSSPYNYYVGNPSLQPSFVQNIELGYTYDTQYNLTAYYTGTHGMFTSVTIQDNTTKLYYDIQQNLGLSVNTGLRISAPFHPASWWEMNLLAEGYYQREKSPYLQGSFDYHLFSYNAILNQSFVISKQLGLKGEINAARYGPGLQGVFRNSHSSELDAGIKTNILHGRGNLRLAANDVLNTYNYHIYVKYLNQDNGFFHRNDSRKLSLTFTYKFGKNVAAARDRTTASEEEKSRAN